MRVLLFSGGLDSTALAYQHRPERLCFINYGQIPAAGERRAAMQIASEIELPIDVVSLNSRFLGHGDMAGEASLSASATEFWPFRNQFLLTIAAMKYAREPELTLMVGTVKSDGVHSDGTPDFVTKMQALLKTQANIHLATPALHLTSDQLLERAAVPTSILGWTFSCHRAAYACGQCRGCNKHYSTLPAE